MALDEHPIRTHSTTVRLDVPALTFFKFFLALIIAASLVRLYPLLLLVSVSGMLAFALMPLIRWMTKKGAPRWLALAIVILAMIGSVMGLIFGIIPELFTQVGALGDEIGPLRDTVVKHLPQGAVREYVGHGIEHPSTFFGNLPSYLSEIGSVAFNSAWSVGVFLITSIYFLVDGGRAHRWILGFFKPETQRKLRKTTIELETIVSAYVGGQVLTSVLVAIFSFVTNMYLHVPGALMLAVIAAIFDVLPIIGFMTSTICAVIMALTVSPETAIIVVILHGCYQLFENYVLVPRVYGKKMKLSTLVVLLSFLVAGPIAGIAGALLVLPLVAAYPVIEKIWLRRYLGEDVVEAHREQLEEESRHRNVEPILT